MKKCEASDRVIESRWKDAHVTDLQLRHCVDSVFV